MIRKFAAALVAVVIAVGAVFADEVKGTFVKFADGTLTIKVDDKEKEYKIPADLKIKRKDKQGNETETVASEALAKVKAGSEGRSHGRRRQGDESRAAERQVSPRMPLILMSPPKSGGLNYFVSPKSIL